MLFKKGLTTARILAVFEEEVGVRRGEVTQTFDDGSRLFARAVFPHLADVRPGDQLRGGVAIKATQDGIWLYPYTFRLICSNGTIVARTIDERPVADPHLRPAEELLHAVREAVEVCCKEEVFRVGVGAMRSTIATAANDMLLAVLPLLSGLSARYQANVMSRFIEHSVPESKAPEARAKDPIRSAVLQSLARLSALHSNPTQNHGDLSRAVLTQFGREGDRSQFGLANAITAVARDVQDPELKWDLEKLGGAVATNTIRRTTHDRGVAAASLAVDEDLVRTA